MNEILKLLRTEHSLQIGNYRNGEYIVKVTNRHGKSVNKTFGILEAETAKHDLLLSNIEQCILLLKEENNHEHS